LRKTRHWKRRIRDAQAVVLEPSASRRPLPDFLVAGAMKAGTTSLYGWLLTCPAVLPARRKEVHYFDRLPARSERWYRTFFPTEARRASVAAHEGMVLTGEATPAYLCHPGAADAAFEIVPDAAVIVLVRDPVQRAWSHYLHERRAGREDRTFLATVEAELQDNRDGIEHPWGIIGRGRYARQLVPWRERYGDRLLTLVSEDLFCDPGDQLQRVADHLGIQPPSMHAFPSLNAGGGPSPDPDDVRRLRDVFEEDNSDLQLLLGRPLPWGGSSSRVHAPVAPLAAVDLTDS
jgi:hypothetical protein